MLEAEYERALQRLGLDPYPAQPCTSAFCTSVPRSVPEFSELAQLFSFDYLSASIREVAEFQRDVGKRLRVLPDGETTEPRVKRPDGSQRDAATTRNITQQEVDARATGNIHPATTLYSLGSFAEIDESYRAQFEVLVTDFQDRGAAIEIILPPYHPTVYNHVREQERYDRILDVEKYLNDYADAHDLRLRGSYDPSVYECANTEFLDGMHPRTTCLVNIFTP